MIRELTLWIFWLFVNPAGVIVLAALDSTTFFWMPLGVDAVVVMLAAQLGSRAWIVPALATAGSLAGAWLTFRIGQTVGEKGLNRFISERRLKKLRKRIPTSGAVTFAALDLIPPPFPFTVFVLTAGALEMNAQRFFLTLAVCRVFRFGLETALAIVYGRDIIARLDSDLFREIAAAFIVLASVVTTVSVARLVRFTRPARRRSAA